MIRTESFPGRLTRFWYNSGRLARIELPAPTTVEYLLTYAGGYLTSVTAPGSRVTTIGRNGSVVTSITDPGSPAVTFGLNGMRIIWRKDRGAR